MGKLKFSCRILAFLGYLVGMVGIPVYLSLPLFYEILQDKTTIGFLAYISYSMIFVLWLMFIVAIFGYAVDDEYA